MTIKKLNSMELHKKIWGNLPQITDAKYAMELLKQHSKYH